MTPPDFWQSKNLISDCLMPLGWLYDSLGQWRFANTRPARAPCPVICVGNLNIGGTGKTPVVAALAEALIQEGQRVHILSRGYGGQLATRDPLRVDPALHTAAGVGDEPLLLSHRAPVWIGRDRVRSARAAHAAGANLLIMDDGFQNPALAKDFSLLVIDAGVGFGNRRVIPAGPLRETIHNGLARADLLVSIGSDAPPRRNGRAAHFARAIRPLPDKCATAKEAESSGVLRDWTTRKILPQPPQCGGRGGRNALLPRSLSLSPSRHRPPAQKGRKKGLGAGNNGKRQNQARQGQTKRHSVPACATRLGRPECV